VGEIKGIAEGLLRILATIIGLIGTVVAFIVVGLHSITADSKAGGIGHGHFFLGLLLTIVALIGSLLSFPAPTVAAVLLVLASIGLFFIAPALSWFAIPLLIIAAILAFLDRKKAKAATAR
jgi:hypothetical protein